MQIGGPGHIVEIDETSLKKKSKYGRGLQHPDNWLFGGVDRTTNLWFGILTGADRKKKTLSPILRKHVKSGYTKMIVRFTKRSGSRTHQRSVSFHQGLLSLHQGNRTHYQLNLVRCCLCLTTIDLDIDDAMFLLH
ncbi:LOW QUALITY PROTEIN: Hypothetical protein PHPALM_11960 [Phytophthora palmivora]|uniref:ISXO2-like transposase domain-containing protein n=1 Tax=Phytophthora palmivora TaxID=4796 RepID=A0A2P4Y0Z7_9STRA|nr:LOW QUALITY PROTEIN: Hypothetical protein PHPALM_11960 [Phytophthora palmivora]